jgi:two-component system, OmpR family, sensor kinase
LKVARPRLLSSLVARAIAVLILAVFVSHGLSMGLYHVELTDRLAASQETQLGEKLAAIKDLVESAPESARETIVHAIGGSSIEAHWDRQSAIAAVDSGDSRFREAAARLVERIPGARLDDLRLSHGSDTGSAFEPNFLLVSLRISDGTWVNASVSKSHVPEGGLTSAIVSTVLMALAVVPLAVWLLRIAIRPLRVFSKAAERLGNDMNAPPLPERGPAEVVQTARAFNEMQRRIRKLLGDRTAMLAAVSHDLRTPITRLRLRAELLDDTEQQQKIVSDIVEMEEMVNSTLSFFRDDAIAEVRRPLDLSSLVRTIVDDSTDLGHDAKLERCDPCVVNGRPIALKRALVNLVENAVKYGDRARIRLVGEGHDAILTIEDDGPGIPEARKDDVFEPFVRLETSRSRQTGGVGLGLALVRSVIRAHDGSVGIENVPDQGLRVIVTLPKLPTSP